MGQQSPFNCRAADDHGWPHRSCRERLHPIYQALAEDERRTGLFRAFPPDFFDLVIVDECHRGSAPEDSSWRSILEYFEPAFQLGMTATLYFAFSSSSTARFRRGPSDVGFNCSAVRYSRSARSRCPRRK